MYIININKKIKVRLLDSIGKWPAPRTGHSLSYL